MPQRGIAGGVLGDAPAVVRGENHQRALRDAVPLQRIQHSPHCGIKALHHRGVVRVLVPQFRPRLRLVFGHQIRATLNRRMHGKVRQVEEKGPVLPLADAFRGFIAEAIGEVFPRGPIRQVRDAVGREVRWRCRLVGAGQIDIKSLPFGCAGLSAQVPLADACRGITRRLEMLRQRLLFQRQLLGPVRREQLRIVRHLPRTPIREMQPRRVLAGHQSRARGRAHRACRVSLGEAQAMLRQLIKVRRLIQIAAVAGEVRPAQVVGQDEDDVEFTIGPLGRVRRRDEDERE